MTNVSTRAPRRQSMPRRSWRHRPAKTPSRAPRAYCRSGARNRPAIRPWAASPIRFRRARRDRVILRVKRSDPFDLAALAQLFQSVGTRRVEQAVISHIAADVGRNQRFCREVRDRFENIGGIDAVVASSCSRCIDGEIALEHGNAPQNDLLGFRQQLVTPIRSPRAESGGAVARCGGRLSGR